MGCYNASDEAITNLLIAGFSRQLKGWWDNYLSTEEKNVILTSVKTEPDGTPILYEGSSIPDSVNTLIFTIIKHFVGDPSLWKDRSAELLSNLKCRTLSDFRWYRDNFLQRVLTRDDANQPFWKEKFLAGLPKSLADKVREKLRNQNDGNISYERLTSGQLVSHVQRTALKICQDDKIQKQLAKEKATSNRELGTFCEQFGFPACKKSRPSKPKHKQFRQHKPAYHKPRKPFRKAPREQNKP